MQPDDRIASRIDAYLHGLLTDQENQEIERLCAADETWKAALEEGRKRQQTLQSIPSERPSERLVKRTVEQTDPEARFKRFRNRFVLVGSLVAATILIALLGLDWHCRNKKPSPIDLRLFSQHSFLAASEASLRIRLINRQTGQPLAGIPVRIELAVPGKSERTTVASFSTDAHGTGSPRFRLPEEVEGNCELFLIAHKPGEAEEVVRRRIEIRRAAHLFLTTDKPVYQPAQTIHIRSLALRRPDGKPLANQEAVFTIQDPRGNILFKKATRTSPFGIAWADCPLAEELIEGRYSVRCKVGTIESALSVNVFKYVLPKIQARVSLDRPYYKPGQTARISVSARYYFGEPLVDANLKVEAQMAGGQPLALLPGLETDARGQAEVSLELPRNAPEGPLTVRVTVSDTAQQQETVQTSATITPSPLRLDTVLEGGTFVPGQTNRLFVSARYVDGSAAAKLTISAGEIGKEATTDETGLASFDLPGDLAGSLTLVVQSDGQGNSARAVIHPDRLPVGDFLFRTDRSVCDAGQALKVEVLGGGSEPVFVDILRDGQTVLTTTVEVKDNRGSLTLDIPAEWAGPLQLYLYRLDAQGCLLRKSRTLFVRSAARLNLEVKPDRPEYRPQDVARVKLTLRDRAGKPVAGAVSLAAVDEAVFGVKTERFGLEERFSELERQLLRPVYTIYPGWSPDIEASPERENAAFAATTCTVSDDRGRATVRQGSQIDSPWTVDYSSYQARAPEFERDRQLALNRIGRGFVVLAISVVLFGYACLWLFCSRVTLLIIHGVLAMVFLTSLVVVPVFLFTGMKQAGMVDDSASLARASAPGSPAEKGSGGQSIRVREEFPETLDWQPQLILGDDGTLTHDIRLADSITTWRLTASAVDKTGRQGSAVGSIRVFQPFFVDLNLPVSLTLGDEVNVPVIVHNHLDQSQTVDLDLKLGAWFAEPWFECLGKSSLKVEVPAKKVVSADFRIKVKKVGLHRLEVSARAGQVADAIRRPIEVVPHGRPVEVIHNGDLKTPATVELQLPNNHVEGSALAVVKIYPSTFSQLLEGLESIFQMPTGCFEQTSSATYPNILALDYLKRTKKASPQVELTARKHIQTGYQRLLSFEVSGGGFDWYGRAPASITLTAYGLMEFQDMARVFDVDPALLRRTRQWLLGQRQSNGSWPMEGRRFYAAGQDPYQISAYVAWAVFADSSTHASAPATREYLLSKKPQDIDDPYTLALAANALLVMDPAGRDAQPYLQRLAEVAKRDGTLAWWPITSRCTAFHGAGQSAHVETTALACLALIKAKSEPALVRQALSWLVSRKDPRGTWHSTQATVLALKALLEGTNQPLGEARQREFEVLLGERLLKSWKVPADQAEVLQQVVVRSPQLQPGKQTLTVREKSTTAANYQVVFRYHLDAPPPKTESTLAVTLDWNRNQARQGETLTATVIATCTSGEPVSMVMLDLPIPPGTSLLRENLDEAVEKGVIARYQTTPRQVIVYLLGVQPGIPLRLNYRVRADVPASVTVPGGTIYAYYNPQNRASTPATRLTVTGR